MFTFENGRHTGSFIEISLLIVAILSYTHKLDFAGAGRWSSLPTFLLSTLYQLGKKR